MSEITPFYIVFFLIVPMPVKVILMVAGALFFGMEAAP
jgi:hypothetical protein